MHSVWAIWLACLAIWAHATIFRPEGQLVIYSEVTRRHSEATSRTITPAAARLIVASKLGIDRYHDIGSISSDALLAINEFSGSQRMFNPRSDEVPVALVILQGVTMKDALLPEDQVATLDIPTMPATKDTETLLGDLVAQLAAHDGSSVTRAVESWTIFSSNGGTFNSKHATVRKIGRSNGSELNPVISSLVAGQYDILIFSIPEDIKTSIVSYGSWTLPAHSHSKREQQEEPLEPPRASSSSSSAGSQPTSPSKDYDQSTPLRGILPDCYASLSACQSSTRNCTGHGSCTLKYKNKDAPESSRNCYSCQCQAEVRTNPDGTKKTTRYGGPACQKKDVVAPFWLLAGFTVAMVSLISWGIGNLYSMGEEKLPSVIGAGVSGPSRRQ